MVTQFHSRGHVVVKQCWVAITVWQRQLLHKGHTHTHTTTDAELLAELVMKAM